ncbi:M56 family metallopeptidase [Sphingomonas sp.]|uniref:M56 family metallopeptidase n=1 Tax=Sphingomonas sp. TaxID=28214 RepID=UPI0035BC27B4
MIGWAIDALIASAALIALVLCVRLPVRRAFGPTVAYALWALPVLRLALPPLPADWLRAAPAPLAAAGERVVMLVLPAFAPMPAAASPLAGIALAGLWGAGVLLFLGWHAVAYRRFTRRVAESGVAIGRVGRIALVVSDAVADPLAYGLVRPVVALPLDFRLRYDAGERALALAHEVAHHRRGDVAANWAALLVLALHWFNPLAWGALRVFRADQEMANDAHVLARRGPGERYAYGCTLAKAAGVGPAFVPIPAAACGLTTANDLKGRLRMLANPTSRARRIAGAAAIGSATLALLGLTASGGDAAATVRAHVEQATGVPLDALASTAMFQEGPNARPAPPGPTVPGSGGRHVATVRDGGAVHVTVTEDGRTRRYEGAAAEAWLAANPQPAPPEPPIAPAPPEADAQARTIVVRPGERGAPTLMVRRMSVAPGAPLPPGVVLPRDFALPDGCGAAGKAPPPAMVFKGEGGDKTYTILCTRSEAASGVEQGAYRQALASLHTVRRSIATQAATPAFPEAERSNALAAVDASIAEIEADLAQTR